MTDAQFYVWQNGEQAGPFTRAELETLWRGGGLAETDFWREESEEKFRPASEVATLFPPALPVTPQPRQDSPTAYLERVRGQSSYQWLRGAMFGLCVIVGSAGILPLILIAFATVMTSAPLGAIAVIAALALSAFWLAVVVCIYQALVIAVDVADLLAHYGFREWSKR